MAQLIGFSNAQKLVVTECMRSASTALEKFLASTASDDLGAWRRTFQTVMGAGSAADDNNAEKILVDSARAMLALLRTHRYRIEYGALNAGENARMQHFNYQQAAANSQSVLELSEAEQGALGTESHPMTLGAPFFDQMPRISLSEQSQVETFLHELSHFAAGTVDQVVGGTCYGWEGCIRAKGQGPLFAVRNAENVGFLLVRYAF